MSASALAPLKFTESWEAQIDDLLMRICKKVQLDETRHKLAEQHYGAAGNFLERHPELALLRPRLYPQGSMCLNTTVKPLEGDEYDLDFVCEFVCFTSYFSQPVDALNLVERALKASDIYRPMVERLNRCIRLNYEHNFHMDILPACKDPKNGGTCILVPDRKLRMWTASNPRGYASWFDRCARQVTVDRLLEKAEPLPNRETAEQKLPLKLDVQLFKRWRDIRYKTNPDLAPISIILTTLAGHTYRGEQSIARGMGTILTGITELTRSNWPRLVVPNPTNGNEDLSERWDTVPGSYQAFLTGIAEFDGQWKALIQTRGIEKVANALQRLFGEELAKNVIEEQVRDIEGARSRDELGMRKSSGILTGTTGAGVMPVPRNTFYGDEK